MKKQPSIGELLSNAVLFARNHGTRQSSKERFARDKWFVTLDNDVTELTTVIQILVMTATPSASSSP
jgi:hypothetical protein